MRNKATLLTLLLALCVQLGYSQSRTISGVVKEAVSGAPLPGVAVIEKDTRNGTSTDPEGKFSLTLTGTSNVLVFQAIGKSEKEVILGTEDFINVQLAEAKEQLEEVVITALGISKDKKALGYAVSEIGGEEISQSGENNIIQSLSAKAPGIQVIGSGGTPGASSKILLRGNATFTGANQPLIVIDGVPIDNSTTQSSPRDYPFNENLQGVNNSNRAIDINPDDIESVTVLKGPAAAALYGARAGNGVIIYTTKRGKAGGKKNLGITVSQKVTLNQVNKLPDFQNTYAQGTGGGTPAGDASATYGTSDPGPDGVFFTGDDVSIGTANSWGPTISSLPGVEVHDNPGNFYQTGVSSNTNFSVVGGTEKTAFRLSAGYLNDQGMIPNTSLDRTNIRLTADNQVNDKIKVGGTVNYTNSQSVMVQNGSNVSGVSLSLFRAPASYDITNYKLENGDNRNYFAAYDNPFYTAYENPFTSNLNRVLGNIYTNIEVTDWLSLSYKLGADYYTDSREQVFALSSRNADFPGLGQVNENVINNKDYYGDLIATITGKLSENWGYDINVGHNFYTSRQEDLFARGRNLALRDFYNLSNASDLYSSQSVTEIATQALFAQAEFDWKNTFYLTLTGRNEWSSTFELDNNSFFYPSVSTSLVFTEFWDNRPDWFDFGKLRYSYANTGISPIAYATRPLYTSPFYTDGFTNGLTVPYLGLNSYAISATAFRSDLLPERLTGNEVGLNLIFAQRRIDLDVTYYHQKTEDALLFQPLANSSGFQQAYVNGGSILNQGFEVSLGLIPVRTDDFSWRVDLNWSMNRSEVLSLVPGVEQFSIESAFASIGSFAVVGQPYGVFYGTVWQRDGEGNLLIDEEGFPMQDPESEGVGNPNPDWLGGMRNTFNYKGVQLSFFFDVRKGGDIWNGTFARLNQIGRTQESAEKREETRLVEGVYAEGTMINGNDVGGQPNTTEITAIDYYRFVVGDAGGASEEFVEEVNWLRLRDVNLSYRFNFEKTSAVFKYLDLSFNARNLLLITNYKGVDPETSLTGAGSNIGGLDYFNNPGSRSYTFGVTFGI